MLIGYFDESGKQDAPQRKCITLAGYLASPEAWARFTPAWQAVLDEFRVPHFHMRELNKEKGPFSHLTPERKLDFLKALASVVAQCGLRGYGALVRVPDLERFNDEHGLQVDAYTFAAYAILVDLADDFPATPVELRMDHFDGCHTKLVEAGRLMSTDAYYPDRAANFRQHITLRALRKSETFRQVLPLQAADFAAWELRREHDFNNEWFETVKPDLDDQPQDWFKSLMMFQLERDGKVDLPFNRRPSFRALSDAARFEGAMWDYRALQSAHRGRNGVW